MNTTHAFQLRAESKHAFQQRQLPHRAAVAVLAGWMAFWPLAVSAAESPARDELRAAELTATALLTRQSGAEEMRKMERIYSDLVAKYPKDAVVKNDQAAFLWSIGAHARAVEAWLAAEKLDPNNAEVLDHLGGSFLAGGNVKKAAGYYARATANAPENAAYHFNYANVAFMFRHELLDTAHADSAAVLRQALAHFAHAARLQPLNENYARAYAETFYTVAEPDWDAALKAWQHFYEITPGKDFALLNLARVHMKLGNKPEARETLARIQNSKFDRLKARLQERIEAE